MTIDPIAAARLHDKRHGGEGDQYELPIMIRGPLGSKGVERQLHVVRTDIGDSSDFIYVMLHWSQPTWVDAEHVAHVTSSRGFSILKLSDFSDF